MASERSGSTAIRRAGGAPIYLQLARILEGQIRGLDPAAARTPLPSEAALAQRFKVSRITARQALKRLESKGLIYSEQGKGSFPTVPRLRGVAGFHSFTAEVLRNGGTPSSSVLHAGPVADLPEAMRRSLMPTEEAGSGEGFFRYRRLRCIDGAPVAVEDAYLPLEVFPGIEAARLKHPSLYDSLEEQWGLVPAWADALFEPAGAKAEEARLLGVPVGDPVLLVWRVTLAANDEVLEYVRSVYRRGDFMLHVARYRLG